jgi:putative DNA primase/helicase
MKGGIYALKYDFNQIPDELKNTPQWIVWRSEEREGKKTKVPYQVNGTMAQSNNKRSWSTFHTAVLAFNTGNYNGIGFMFSKEDPYIGIDIDHCVSDGVPNTFAQEIIELMNSYTEYSPSNEGVHIIVKGSLPSFVLGTGKKNPEYGLEVYRHGRYFTFTGNRENNNQVFERTDELEELFQKYLKEKEVVRKSSSTTKNLKVSNLSNSELWERMFSSKNGSSIRDLFNGVLINNDHSSSDLALCNHLAFWTDNDPVKMDSMFRESSLERDKWDKVHSSDGSTYGEITIANAIRSTSSTISDFEVEKPYEIYIGNDDVEDPQEGKEEAKSFHLTELGNAERIIYHHGKNLKYCAELEWLIWNDKYWEVDSKREIESIAARTFRAMYLGTEAEVKWAAKCERRSVRINSILDARPMVAVRKSQFDSHSYLFNCSNGVVDLKKGELLPHDRSHLLTKISNVQYDKNADCPNWKAFLKSIFVDDNGKVNHEIIDFLQKAVGYTLTGDITEQVMFFLYGTGRNGKSTFINTIQHLLGDYGRQTNSDTFIKKRNENPINNDIARLDGARFVSAVESEEGQQLSESLVKQITGGEKMSARFLRQEFFEFTPEFKVFFTTNHIPIIKNNDEGIWRRIRLIPFTVTIPKEKVDKKLPEKLAAEMPGILRWAVEGCLKWQKEGLGEPEAVRKATDDYRQDMDILGPFLSEICVINQMAKVETKLLYEEYKHWCMENDEAFTFKNRAFYRAIETRGYKKKPGAKNKLFFHGIGLRKHSWVSEEGLVNDSLTNPQNVTPINRKML